MVRRRRLEVWGCVEEELEDVEPDRMMDSVISSLFVDDTKAGRRVDDDQGRADMQSMIDRLGD